MPEISDTRSRGQVLAGTWALRVNDCSIPLLLKLMHMSFACSMDVSPLRSPQSASFDMVNGRTALFPQYPTED